jgi:uncharacterized protein (DUF2249 family)
VTARQTHGAVTGAPEHGHRAAIDLRRFEPRERLPLLEMSLAVLEAGESVQATFESPPDALVRYLERAYRGRFEWWFAGEGEDWCLLEIRRHARTGTAP